MSNPWFKFYPRDWRGDQALRACSIAARGLWMECLCIMHEAKPYGHLLLNGDPVEGDTLARMAGISVDEVHSLLGELRQAGVLSVTRNGVIFSRRMTKDHARAQKGKAAVKKRWGKNTTETKPQAPDTEQKSGAPNRPPTSKPITQKPESRSQNKRSDDDEGARASSRSGAVDRERLLKAMGLSDSGVAGPSTIFGTYSDMVKADRWHDDLGFEVEDIYRIIEEAMRRKANSSDPGMPKSFQYFDTIMRRLHQDLQRPPPNLTPIQGGRSDGPARTAEDPRSRAMRGLAESIRDHIAVQSGGGRHRGDGD